MINSTVTKNFYLLTNTELKDLYYIYLNTYGNKYIPLSFLEWRAKNKNLYHNKYEKRVFLLRQSGKLVSYIIFCKIKVQEDLVYLKVTESAAHVDFDVKNRVIYYNMNNRLFIQWAKKEYGSKVKIVREISSKDKKFMQIILDNNFRPFNNKVKLELLLSEIFEMKEFKTFYIGRELYVSRKTMFDDCYTSNYFILS